jgi:hypothetical protein
VRATVPAIVAGHVRNSAACIHYCMELLWRGAQRQHCIKIANPHTAGTAGRTCARVLDFIVDFLAFSVDQRVGAVLVAMIDSPHLPSMSSLPASSRLRPCVRNAACRTSTGNM